MKFELHHGDCLDVLKTLADCSVDAIVTDPPAGIAFMNREWDRDKGGKAEWIQWMQSVADQCLRVIKPGGHALVWAIPRTSHWTGAAWEDAGWQPRDKIYHVFGSGFPKSLDVSKAIDKAAGAERERYDRPAFGGTFSDDNGSTYGTAISNTPATQAAKQWDGWGTALKPAAEEWWLFRKPLIGTVAANVHEHGTGGLNIGACRVEVDPADPVNCAVYHAKPSVAYGKFASKEANQVRSMAPPAQGRFPANFIHDGSDEVLALLGEAARFYYSPKASRDDRDEGCGALELTEAGIKNDSGRGFSESDPMAAVMRHNPHPTVKPTDLMRYLCRLITPPGGIVLDPFTGSGSTGKAAMAEGFRFIGIEREAEYIEIARARISAEAEKPRQLSLF
jgi:site-specific DNA-methyltransferase (adenine-specific)